MNKIEFPKLIKMSPFIKQYSQNDLKPAIKFSCLT